MTPTERVEEDLQGQCSPYCQIDGHVSVETARELAKELEQALEDLTWQKRQTEEWKELAMSREGLEVKLDEANHELAWRITQMGYDSEAITRMQNVGYELDVCKGTLRAIIARLDGVYDHPDLMEFGPLGDGDDDVKELCNRTLKLVN